MYMCIYIYTYTYIHYQLLLAAVWPTGQVAGSAARQRARQAARQLHVQTAKGIYIYIYIYVYTYVIILMINIIIMVSCVAFWQIGHRSMRIKHIFHQLAHGLQSRLFAMQLHVQTATQPGSRRKGAGCGWKPSSSSNISIRAFRAYPLVEIRQTVPCRAIRGKQYLSQQYHPPPLKSGSWQASQVTRSF